MEGPHFNSAPAAEFCNKKRNWLDSGGGDKFRFWEDPWLDTAMPLREKYPMLYNISSQKQTTISCMGTNNSTGWEWNLTWRRDLFESELLLADTFIGDLAQQQVQPHRED